jgi:hypothetical protein
MEIPWRESAVQQMGRGFQQKSCDKTFCLTDTSKRFLVARAKRKVLMIISGWFVFHFITPTQNTNTSCLQYVYKRKNGCFVRMEDFCNLQNTYLYP